MDGERGQWLQDVYQDSAVAECRNTEALRATLPELSKALPDHTIILRPHPGENAGVWERLLAGVPNVEVSNRESLHAQMLSADVVVHLAGCGAGLEAALAGRRTVCFNPVVDCTYPKLGISSGLSPNAMGAEDLIRLVTEAVDNRSDGGIESEAKAALVAAYVRRSDQLCSEAIASYISDLFTRLTGAPPRPSQSVRAETMAALREALRAAKTKAEATAFGNIGLRTKRLAVTKDEICHTVRTLESCLGFKAHLTVTTPTEGVFILRDAGN